MNMEAADRIDICTPAMYSASEELRCTHAALPHRIAPHRTAPHRTAPRRHLPQLVSRWCVS
jgi:hypothetical protein